MKRLRNCYLLMTILFMGFSNINATITFIPADNSGAVILLAPGQQVDLTLSYTVSVLSGCFSVIVT